MNEQHVPPRGSSGPPEGRLARLRVPTGPRAAFAAGLGAGGLGLMLVVLLSAPAPSTLSVRDMEATVDRVLASQVPGPAYSALVYQVIAPSLVLVETDRSSLESGETTASDEPLSGIGTAVVVTAAGDVLTALHVVEGSESIRLTYADGSTSAGYVVNTQPEKDIAVLQPETPPAAVMPATLGNPNQLRVGDEAYVVGHPYGLVGSMSSGVISGLNRSIEHPDGETLIDELIQIDAAVNPGNSGGPLLNRAGHVTGIVTALLNPNEDRAFAGIGLAVPIDIAGGAAGLPPY